MKKIMVVTGASSGIGKEFVIQMANTYKYDEIWAIDRNREGLDELRKLVPNVKRITIDLTNQEEIKKLPNLLKKEKERVVIKTLINCAGFGIFEHSENISLDDKLNMIDLNVKAYVSMIDYCLPNMTNGAKIINVASCAAFQPIPYVNTYASTKAFVLSYSRALNQELKYKNIQVLAVTPFWTKTNFFDRAVNKKKKEVVIKYTVMYETKDVVAKAIKDLNKNKDVSCYGKINNLQRLLVKLAPHKTIMKIWMHDQKLNGTPKIR